MLRSVFAVFEDLMAASGIRIPVNCMVRFKTCVYHQRMIQGQG